MSDRAPCPATASASAWSCPRPTAKRGSAAARVAWSPWSGSFDVLNLFAQLLDLTAHVQANCGERDIVRLGAERVGLSRQLLRQKVETTSDRAAGAYQLPRGGDMSRQPVEFFADVRLGRQEDRLLMQTVLVEAAACVEKGGDGLSETGANRLRPAARIVVGGLGQSGDRGQAFIEKGGERRPFGLAHGDESDDRLIQALERAFASGREAHLVLARFAHVDDAAYGEEAVDRWRREAGAFGRLRGGAGERGQRIGVDLDLGDDAFALCAQRRKACPARQRLAQPRSRLALDPVKAWGHPQAQIEPFGVDALDLEDPAIGPVSADRSGEARHTGKAHRLLTIRSME